VEAFRNIGEVSTELDVKKHVLRFWESKFPQLKPMKRGGGRRLYRPSDVELLRGIRDLLQSSGYKIEGVQKLLREHGVEHVKLAGNCRIGGGSSGEEAPRRAAAPLAVVSRASLQLSPPEVEALRTVMAELDACRGLLASAGARGEAGERHRERALK
jgi:DNA-binding transcriptional MerR regulator